jgi:thiamine pyrophosphokinase
MNNQPTLYDYTIDNTFFDKFESEENLHITTIHLNRPFDHITTRKLFSISQYSILADGAANHFYDNHIQGTTNQLLPDAIIGDLDSIRDEVIEFYKSLEVTILKDSCQDDSDLEKCLRHVMQRLTNLEHQDSINYKIVITGALGGRMDHTMNNIHILHKFSETHLTSLKNVSIILMDENSMATCIMPGRSRYIKAKNFEMSKGVGFFPLFGAAIMKTKGLKWDLDENSPKLSFKKFISSSNEFLGEEIELETDQIIFFTTTCSLHEKAKI